MNSSQADVRRLVDRAQRLQAQWQGTARATRAGQVRQLASRLADRADDLAQLMAGEIGKPVRFGRVEAQRTVQMLEAIVHRFESTSTEPVGPALLRRRPHGVVAVITPWNNPIYLALGKIVPAVLYGNAVVWKPAPEAATLSRSILEECHQAGWPQRLVSLLEGGTATGCELMADEGIAAVTITGSASAGASAQAICGRRRIPLQAELGGNNAAVIWTDADLRQAARLVAAGAFEMAGQRCTANRRVIVPVARRDEILRLLLEEGAALEWGDPFRLETRIGPLVSTAHADRVRRAVAWAIRDGAPVYRTHHPVASRDEGPWHPPTIVCCDDPQHEIVQEETFGPVLVVQTARDWDQAMRLCNGVRQGLAASVFTSSPEVAGRFLEEAQAGILKVNQSTADAAVDVPFGGWKESGLGPPEHGAFDVEFYTRPQTVYGSFPSAA